MFEKPFPTDHLKLKKKKKLVVRMYSHYLSKQTRQKLSVRKSSTLLQNYNQYTSTLCTNNIYHLPSQLKLLKRYSHEMLFFKK